MVPLQAARLFNQICDAVRYLHTEKQLVWSSVEELLSESRIIPMVQGNCGIAVVLFLFVTRVVRLQVHRDLKPENILLTTKESTVNGNTSTQVTYGLAD